MNPHPLFLTFTVAISILCPWHAMAEPSLFDETQAQTIFAFDDVSIPFTRGLRLEMRQPERHPANPVLDRRKPGNSDSWAVQFYGSVIKVGDTYRMWYVAAGDDRLDRRVPRSSPWRVAYAESQDGVNWERPNLGLVEYGGNRNNNLVKMEPRLGTVNVKVLHEPEDEQWPYKMGAHVWFPKNDVRLGTLAPYGSKDGLSWELLVEADTVDAELDPNDLVLPPLHFEPVGGLYKWEGLYYLSGQNAFQGTRPTHGRVMRQFVSPDFVQWSQASGIGFIRSAQHEILGPGRSREGEQLHEAISVWNRRNVLVGIYGIWHGAENWEGITVDLGFVLSNDGLKFREPAHEWVFLERGADGAWDQGGVLQGQGFENIGDHTHIYYGAWDPRAWKGSPPRGGVGIALLERDRFAELIVDESIQGSGTYQLEEIVSEFFTGPIPLDPSQAHEFYVNAEGLNDHATLRIEMLDAKLQPVPGYIGTLATSGFQVPVRWEDESATSELPAKPRFRVTYEGEQRAGIKFCALYVR